MGRGGINKMSIVRFASETLCVLNLISNLEIPFSLYLYVFPQKVQFPTSYTV